MRKAYVAFCCAVIALKTAFGTDIFNVPVQFTTGSSIAITSGVPLTGTWDFTAATVLGIGGGSLTLTGAVTGTGSGTIATTLTGIPDLIPEPGSILFSQVAAPVAPAAGLVKAYANSTDARFHDVNAAGTTGTTIVAATAPANQFSTGFGTNGVETFRQPVPGDISGAIPLANLATQSANTVVGNATGSTAVPTAVSPATARTNSLLNVDEKTTVGDASYVILPTDRTVVSTTTLTASRTLTLPAANSVNTGQSLDIEDLAGAVNGANIFTVQTAGADHIFPGSITSWAVTSSQVGFGITLKSDGVSKWYVSAFNPGGTNVNHRPVTADGRVFQMETYALPSTVGGVDYAVNSNGSTMFQAYPTGLASSSTTGGAGGYAADTYIGNPITIAAGDFKAQGQFHCVFDMAKTGAGTATPIITVRVGTAGTTADAAICTLTFSAGTAAIDAGTFEVWVTFRTVGSGTSAVFQAVGQCNHQGAGVGLVSKNSDTVNNTSSGFASTTQTKIGVSFNGGTSFVGTNTLAQATLTQP